MIIRIKLTLVDWRDVGFNRRRKKIWMPRYFLPCDQMPNKAAYTIPEDRTVVLCPLVVQQDPTVGDRTRKESNIDYIAATTMSVTMFHEILHLFFPERESSILNMPVLCYRLN